MNDKKQIQKTADFVKAKFAGESSGHDWWHMYRVWKISQRMAKEEQAADKTIVELAAILHDIADWKFHEGDMEAGPKAAREWLTQIELPEEKIKHIEEIIRTVSYKGSGVASNMKTIEGKIVHDADKIDAIGAMGISRTFAYGGANGREIYNPEIKPSFHQTFEEYQKDNGPTINHFYEKLLLLKDRMYTDAGKRIAVDRHKFMEDFLEEFYLEWDGKK